MKKVYVGLFFLVVTISYFIYSGLLYLSLGSFLPSLFILLILLLFIFAVRSSRSNLSRAVKFWSVLVIIWSVIRLLLFFTDLYLKPIPEAHVHHQLTSGLPLSLIFLVAGICLFIFRKVITDFLFTRYKSLET